MVDTRQQRASLMRRQVLRLRNACVYQSWLTWSSTAAALVRAKGKASRAVAVMRHGCQKKCLNAWCDDVQERKRARRWIMLLLHRQDREVCAVLRFVMCQHPTTVLYRDGPLAE